MNSPELDSVTAYQIRSGCLGRALWEEHDLAALSARFDFRLEPYQDLDVDTAPRLLISALRGKARTPQAAAPSVPLLPRRIH